MVEKKLKEIRLLRGMTQFELAQQIGVREHIVSHWERGITRLPADQVPAICSALQIGVCDLYDGGCYAR